MPLSLRDLSSARLRYRSSLLLNRIQRVVTLGYFVAFDHLHVEGDGDVVECDSSSGARRRHRALLG